MVSKYIISTKEFQSLRARQCSICLLYFELSSGWCCRNLYTQFSPKCAISPPIGDWCFCNKQRAISETNDTHGGCSQELKMRQFTTIAASSPTVSFSHDSATFFIVFRPLIRCFKVE